MLGSYSYNKGDNLKMKPRAIVIDDDPAVHETIRQALSADYELEFVDRPDIAWELFLFFKEPIDILIMEVVLSKTDGVALLRKIREIHPWLPVLIITGHSTHERAKEICNLNVAGYIEKPVTDVKLLRERVAALRNYSHNMYMKFMSRGNEPVKAQKLHPVTMRCLSEIHKNFNMPITDEFLADNCGVSRSHLCKIFKSDCGITIKDYITGVRLDAAKKLLQNTAYTVSDIQEYIGYKSRTHFFNTFKRRIGVSPRLFRRSSAVHEVAE